MFKKSLTSLGVVAAHLDNIMENISSLLDPLQEMYTCTVQPKGSIQRVQEILCSIYSMSDMESPKVSLICHVHFE